MVMEVLERCATREQALRREQEFIHELGTAAPRGWNRQVRRKPKKYKARSDSLKVVDGELHCPVCGCENMHFNYYESDEGYTGDVVTYYRRSSQEMEIGVKCEQCHHDDNDYSPPSYCLSISDDNGTLHFRIEYYVEDKS
jgi:hypothetical protein